MKHEGTVNPEFIDVAVDFIRTYADRCHHGKEEDILFRDLNKKELPDELKRIIEELIEEHKLGRKAVADLVEAEELYIRGNKNVLPVILDCLRFMTDFYPRHIEKEDKHFFLPCMNYLTPEEEEAMSTPASPLEKLKRIFTLHLDYIEKNEGIPRLVFSEEIHQGDKRLKGKLLNTIDSYAGRLESIIKEGQKKGLIKGEIDSRACALTMIGMIQITILRWSLSDFTFSPIDEGAKLWENFEKCVTAK